MESRLSSKVKVLLKDELMGSEVGLITSLLQSEKGYGRAVIDNIGENATKLYLAMSAKEDIDELNDDYSFLIDILETAGLRELASKIRNLVRKSQLAPACLQNVQVIGSKRPHSSTSDGENKRLRINSEVSEASPFSPDELSKSQSFTQLQDHSPCCGDNCYNVNQGKGFVAIINNFTRTRKGTVEDEEKIRKFFSQPKMSERYEVAKYARNLNSTRFKETLKEWAQKLEHGKGHYHSFFLFILSHGNKEGVMAFHENEDDTISVDDINKEFESCLRGKPKVVVIQACRGDKDAVAVERDGISSTTQTAEEMEVEEVESDGSRMKFHPPDKADMLTAFSTVEGYRAYRNKTGDGSWFIQNLITQLDVCDTKRIHFLEILTDTLQKVSSRHAYALSDTKLGNKNIYIKQMPSFQSTLTKRFYLLPRAS